MRFAASAARYVSELRIHASQSLHPDPPGGVQLTVRLAATPEFLAWVRSFGPAAELLSPPELRAEMMADLKQASEFYQSRTPCRAAAMTKPKPKRRSNP